MKAKVKLFILSYDLGIYRISTFAQSRQSLRWRDLDEGSGKIVVTSYVIKYLSHKRAAKDQASMRIRTVSP